MVISQYVIENDSFQRKMCCTLVSRNAKPCPQGLANLNRDTKCKQKLMSNVSYIQGNHLTTSN